MTVHPTSLTLIVHFQFREAQEEVSLPRDCPHIQTLCLLDPHISLHKLVVTPVVAFLSNPAVLDTLVASEGEVAHIFSHPLEAFLDPTIVKDEPLVPIGSEDWIYDTQFHVGSFLMSCPTLSYHWSEHFRLCSLCSGKHHVQDAPV